MSKAKRVCALMVVLLLTAAVSVSAATGFVVPPTFNPQRMLLWDFSNEATWQTPVTAIGPTWDQGAWICDDVTVTGDMQWFDTNANWPGRQGMIGIVNNTEQNLSGSVIFHINNYISPNPYKLMCLEYEHQKVPGYSTSTHIEVPEGFTITQGSWDYTDLYPGERIDWDGTIVMNPPWEEIRLTFTASPGGAVLMDNLYVATACVPEPSSLLALSGGLLGILSVVRRKRD